MREDKYDELAHEINKHFGNVDFRGDEFENSYTAMVEVEDVSMDEVSFRDYDTDEGIVPLKLPPAILALLVPGDLFMVQFALRDDQVEILYMSPPYHSMDWQDQEELPRYLS